MIGKRNTVVCFSGHRYYAGSPEDEARLAEAVQAAYAAGYRIFISEMAQGFDLAAAEAVLRLRGSLPDVRLICAVPFARQTHNFPPADLARHDAVIAAADEAKVLSERYSHGCYYRRDDWMVERSGRIICWYDGGRGSSRTHTDSAPTNSPRTRTGSGSGSGSGTRYTVRRAVAAGLEVVNLFRDSDGLLF